MEDLADSKLRDNTTCTLRSTEPNVVSFHNDQLITVDVVDLPAGAVVVSKGVPVLPARLPVSLRHSPLSAHPAGVPLQRHRQVPAHRLEPPALRERRVGRPEACLLRPQPGERLRA